MSMTQIAPGFNYRGKMMASDHKSAKDGDTTFSFATSELQQAKKRAEALSLDPMPRTSADEQRGFDPYNTSGSFDRKKNWARVGKR
jgi:hypothetical protein